MGGPVIETIAPGIQFVPEAAAAFRRANAQVRAEFGRDIDVNSTYRDWDTQLRMHDNWNRYVNSGYDSKLYPGHSKALHPSDPLAFHTKGTALDSDDWRNQRIEAILAEHGFIRNRLYVKNEQHHFEWLRDYDRHINDPIPEDDMPLNDEDKRWLKAEIAAAVWNYQVGADGKSGQNNEPAWKRLGRAEAAANWVKTRIGGSWQGEPITNIVQWIKDRIGGSYKGDNVTTVMSATLAAVQATAEEQGLDVEKIQAAIDEAVRESLSGVEITLTTKADTE